MNTITLHNSTCSPVNTGSKTDHSYNTRVRKSPLLQELLATGYDCMHLGMPREFVQSSSSFLSPFLFCFSSSMIETTSFLHFFSSSFLEAEQLLWLVAELRWFNATYSFLRGPEANGPPTSVVVAMSSWTG